MRQGEYFSLYLTVFRALCGLSGYSGSCTNALSILWRTLFLIVCRLKSTGVVRDAPFDIIVLLLLRSLALYFLALYVVISKLYMGYLSPVRSGR